MSEACIHTSIRRKPQLQERRYGPTLSSFMQQRNAPLVLSPRRLHHQANDIRPWHTSCPLRSCRQNANRSYGKLSRWFTAKRLDVKFTLEVRRCNEMPSPPDLCCCPVLVGIEGWASYLSTLHLEISTLSINSRGGM
jgi:hypothetical protein